MRFVKQRGWSELADSLGGTFLETLQEALHLSIPLQLALFCFCFV